MRKLLSLLLILPFFFGSISRAQTPTPPGQTATMGGQTASSAMGDTDQMMMHGAFGSLPGDPIGQMNTFRTTYNQTGGFPILSWLGLNTQSFTSSDAFRSLFWGFLYFAVSLAMGRGVIICLKKGNPIPELAKVFYKIIIGFGIISLRGTLYSLIMVVALTMSNTVSIMQQNAILPDALRNANMSNIQFEAARKASIDNAVSMRAGMLFPEGVSLDDEIAIATAYNSMAAEANVIVAGNHRGVTLPLVDTSAQPNEDETQRIARIGRFVMLRAYPLVEDYAGFPAFATNISVTTPAGSSAISNLGNLLQAGPEATRVLALALPNTPDSQSQFQSYLSSYKSDVTDITGKWIELNILQQSLLGHAWSATKEWLDSKVDSIASIASTPMVWMQKMVNALATGIGYVCTLMVGFIFTLGVRVLVEMNLFLLIIAMPIWFIPSWEKAFIGILKSLVSLTIMVPAFQMLMLFADTVMAALLRLIMLGPGGVAAASSYSGSVAANSAATGTTALYVGSMAAFDPFGYIALIVGYTFGYLAFTFLMALKTPSLVKKGLEGAGIASAILSTWATGMIAGGLGAVAMAGAASGGMLGGTINRALKGGNYARSLAQGAADQKAAGAGGDASKSGTGAGEATAAAPAADAGRGYSKRKKGFSAVSKKIRDAVQQRSSGPASASDEAKQSNPAETGQSGEGATGDTKQGRLVRAAMGLGKIARHTPQVAFNAFKHTREGAGSTFGNYMGQFKGERDKAKAAAEEAANNQKKEDEKREQVASVAQAVSRPQPVSHPSSSRGSQGNTPGMTQREVRPAAKATKPKAAAPQPVTTAPYQGKQGGNTPRATQPLPSRPSIPQKASKKAATPAEEKVGSGT